MTFVIAPLLNFSIQKFYCFISNRFTRNINIMMTQTSFTRIPFLCFLGRMIASIFICITLSTNAYSEDRRLARYSVETLQPTKAQENLLSVVVTVRFLQNVSTVGSAIKHLLKGSGYSLAETSNSDPFVNKMYALELPTVHRMIGPVTINRGLRILAGDAWGFIEDPVHRLISFELKKSYRELYESSVARKFSVPENSNSLLEEDKLILPDTSLVRSPRTIPANRTVKNNNESPVLFIPDNY